MILECANLVLVSAGWVLLPRLGRGGKAGGATGVPDLSIIIPARDEEERLAPLLDSIARQSLRPSEVLVVDDGSTDATAEVARRHGARVVTADPQPGGWWGKTWACGQGAVAARGEVLLFLDADVVLEGTDALADLVAAWPGGAFSLAPWHRVVRPDEHFSLFFNLAMVLGTVPHALLGPVLLIDRGSYVRCGGHERVRDALLEHVRLGLHCRSLGIPVASANGRGIVRFRMYPGGFKDLVHGWSKGFASGAGDTPRWVMAVMVLWFSGLLMAPVALLAGGMRPLAMGVAALALVQVVWFARRVGSFRPVLMPLYPVALVFFFVVFFRGMWRGNRSIRWKGREMHAG